MVDDDEVLKKLEEIRFRNKVLFSKYLYNKTGIVIDPKTRFDVQIKRFHEYKRQLLNALKIVALLVQLEENPQLAVTSQTFIFGGKAAPGYYQAKEVIELINAISKEIDKRPDIKEKLNVVFVEDYNVSLAELLILPVKSVNKFPRRKKPVYFQHEIHDERALTCGTLDGANVEINELVGNDNMFLFGMKTEGVEALWAKGYRARDYYDASPLLQKVIERLNRGFSNKSFTNITNYLLDKYPVSDPFMCLADFESYMAMHRRMDEMYKNRRQWNKSSLINIAQSGTFSADRSIREYAKKIWHLQAIKSNESNPLYPSSPP
jgi:starch phosphorylase